MDFVFDAGRMKNLVMKDNYLKSMFKDLSKRNPSQSEEYILEILYTANVDDYGNYWEVY